MMEHHLTEQLQSYFPDEVEYVLRDPLLFGDCRNAINVNDQMRIYEDLIDYDSVFYLFQEVRIDDYLNFDQDQNIWKMSCWLLDIIGI